MISLDTVAADFQQYSDSTDKCLTVHVWKNPERFFIPLMRDFICPRHHHKKNLCHEKNAHRFKARRFIIQMKGIADKMSVGTMQRSLQYFIVKVFYRACV